MNRPTSTFYSCTYTTKDKKSFLALARILRSEALKNYTAKHNHSNPVASAGIYQLSHIPNPQSKVENARTNQMLSSILFTCQVL